MSKLTMAEIKRLAPRAKEYKHCIGNGLYVRVRPSGAKSWIFVYRTDESRDVKRLTMGTLNDFTLKEAINLAKAYKFILNLAKAYIKANNEFNDNINAFCAMKNVRFKDF